MKLNTDALENHLAAAMTEERIPALAVAIVDGKRTVYAQGFGSTVTDPTGRPVTAETLFRIASTTKPLTATLIMRLVAEGSLALDEPVIAHIPELQLSMPDAAGQVTARHLLSHQSGLPSGGEELGHSGPNALRDFVRETLPEYELVAPPGVLYSYSNPGYSLLGHLAECVTGQSFETLMGERVFAPLGMKFTSFDPLVALTYPFALPHRLEGDRTLEPVHALYDEPAARPAGFAMTNAADLALFAQMLLNEGSTPDEQLLESSSVKEMLTPQADMLTASGDAYGLGIFLRNHKGIAIAEHGGSMPTYETAFSIAPKEGYAVIVLSNRPHTGAIAKLSERLWDEVLTPSSRTNTFTAARADESNHEAFTSAMGDYVGKRRGLVRLGLDDATPWMELNGWRLPLRAVRKNVYAGDFDGGSISLGIVQDNDNQPQFVLIDGVVCERTNLTDTQAPNRQALERLVGRYESFDVINVELIDGSLTMTSQMYGQRRMKFHSLGELRFASDYGVVEFIKDEKGNIRTLTVWDQFPLLRSHPATTEK